VPAVVIICVFQVYGNADGHNVKLVADAAEATFTLIAAVEIQAPLFAVTV
jgi:hypothetical protein